MSQSKPDIYKANTCPPCPPTATAFERLVYWLGIGLGSGLPRRAAGTWGTVGGLIIAIPMILAGFWAFVTTTALGLIFGSFICGKTSALMGIDDDPHIVWDEWVGMWLALLPSLFVLHEMDGLSTATLMTAEFWLIFGTAFVLFRVFDVLKPAPISWADEHLTGGFGIMMDDVLAGIIAGMITVIGLFSFGILPS